MLYCLVRVLGGEVGGGAGWTLTWQLASGTWYACDMPRGNYVGGVMGYSNQLWGLGYGHSGYFSTPKLLNSNFL